MDGDAVFFEATTFASNVSVMLGPQNLEGILQILRPMDSFDHLCAASKNSVGFS